MRVKIQKNHIALSAECDAEVYQLSKLSDSAREDGFEVDGFCGEAFWVCFYYPKQVGDKCQQ